ncbi:ADP-ribosyl-(dinitrogen reductase) hydrolase [Paraburkholderia humisilvae]|uniref:ADP-ribosyl-(Dinitrogen reductase) hydrolase n=1 Tax=Paraburkholderia humisilvae TaxID=627669 RepID=A0A6J5DHS9_9BURK|nr:hypothetical protein LMG29542_02166 [Paraburkholderia humisilvae]
MAQSATPNLQISPSVQQKLAGKKPPVKQDEILQCFANREGKFLLDTREDHKSDPPTRWFIAETNFGRKLKIAFIPRGAVVTIRTAYDPNDDELRIYNKHGMQTN